MNNKAVDLVSKLYLQDYSRWITCLIVLLADPEILNGLRWSAALDRVFTKNFEEDPTLRWQYFGSARGFMRIYPALRYVH